MKNILILLSVLGFVNIGLAEDLVPDTEAELKAKNEVKKGWSKKLDLGLNLSLTSNNKVVGQTDGDSKTFGLSVNSSFNYKTDRHESRTDISLTEATTTAPPVKRHIKSSDELQLSSIYLYSFENTKWLGPYARVKAQTALRKGEHIQQKTDSPDTYSISRDGTTTTVTATELKLTDPFKPLSTRESLGLFARAIEKKGHSLIFRLGFGALQVSADDQLTVDDNADTANVIEVKELESYSQSGIEFGADWTYTLDEKTSLSAFIDTLTPMGSLDATHKVCPDCSGTELTDIDAGFKLATKLYGWVSLTYEIKYKRQPQLVKADQVQNLVLANFSYSIF